MDTNKNIADILAKRLKEIRKSKGLSLEATAKLSGVSRSMLSQIERKESSPTVATLWSLSRALQVDFAELLDNVNANNTIKEIMRANRTPTIDSQGEGCRIRILSSPTQAGKLEIYEIQFTTDGILASDPHRHGCSEQLTVIEGEIVVSAGKESVELSEGDTIRYAADCNHTIRAAGKPSKALLIVQNS